METLDVKYCKRCGAENPTRVKFCGECGYNAFGTAGAVKYCLYCAHEEEKDKNFCTECGESAFVDTEEELKKSLLYRLSRVLQCAAFVQNVRENGNPEATWEGILAEFKISGGIVREYYGKGGTVFVPPVAHTVGGTAFQENQEIERVILPEGIKEIRKEAFKNCKNLKEVRLPQSLTAIRADAFSLCSALEKIEIPAKIKKIERGTFTYCSKLSEIQFGEGLAYIEELAFFHCSSLCEIVFPESVVSIGRHAFMDSTQLGSDENGEDKIQGLKKVTLGKNVAVLGGGFVSALVEVKIHPQNKYFEMQDGYLIEKAKNRLVKGANDGIIPYGIKIIGDSAFENCWGMEYVQIPETVEIIENCAFLNCLDLRQVTLESNGRNLRRIGWEAFNCTYLAEFYIPASVEFIGGDCFGWEAWMRFRDTKLYVQAAQAGENWAKTWNRINYDEEYIPVVYGVGLAGEEPEEETEESFAVEGEEKSLKEEIETPVEDFDFVIKNGVLLEYNGGDEDVTVPDGVKEIGERAFMMNRFLRSVRLPRSVEKIGAGAFYSCKKLQKIELGGQETRIGESAFYSCLSLEMIKLPASVTTIEKCAFEGCQNLKIYTCVKDKPQGWVLEKGFLGMIKKGTDGKKLHWNPDNCPVTWKK